jgi:hypothetical protein
MVMMAMGQRVHREIDTTQAGRRVSMQLPAHLRLPAQFGLHKPLRKQRLAPRKCIEEFLAAGPVVDDSRLKK